MYLVTDSDTISQFSDPARFIATVVIDELESLAVDCREAAADYGRMATQPSQKCARSLNQAAQTCDEIRHLLQAEYLSGRIRRREEPSSALAQHRHGVTNCRQ